jgi:HCOMODA/2-hydroxy-3-carboxy-muconic semialdehyde decarboxylase
MHLDDLTRRDLFRYSALILTGPLVRSAQAPASAGAADPALIEDLVAASRIIAQQGIVDAFGHVSVRHDRSPNRFLLSRSLAPALLTREDIIEYDLDSNPVNADGRAQFSERFIHGEIYKARPDVKAVVHNHSPSIVPFSISTVAMRPVYHMSAFIGEGLPVFDIRAAAGMTDMLVSNGERGRALAKMLGNKPAVLMRGHGAAVVGASLPFAVGRSVYLELNARMQIQAMSLNGSITYLDPQEAAKIVDGGENRGYERAWELWKRQVSEER